MRVIDLPAIAHDDDEIGRKPGDPLCPERFPLPKLEELKALDGAMFASLYQGRPTPADGDVFKESNLLTYTDLPEKGSKFATLDLAHSTKTRADYSVLTLFKATPAPSPKLYVTHMFRDKVESGRHMAWVDECVETLPAAERPSYIVVEDKTFGSTLLSAARIQGRRGKPLLKPFKVDSDKETRAQPAALISSQGQLLFPAEAPWLADAKHELLVFPNGTHDDIVDTISMGGIEFTKSTHHEPAERKPVDRSPEARAQKNIKARKRKRRPASTRKHLIH